ncbi:MAG TPA: ABC transporter permease [Myxococcota bacterium]|jgi:phospholipid/cholesterol/gamma-HCH transport system permease protein
MIVAVGERVLGIVVDTGALIQRTLGTLRAVLLLRVDRRETLRQLDRMLGEAAPLMLLSCAVVGGIVAMQGLGYIKKYSASEVFGWAAALSAYRDVGPLLLGCGLAARIGARTTGEVAMMAARERLDAIRALGLDPERVLIAPRVVASILTAALLYVPSCTLVLVVGFALAALIGDQSMSVSFWSFATYLDVSALVNGLARMALFGAVIGIASCEAGASVEKSTDRSAAAIGRAVYFGSVVSLCGVMSLNAILSLIGSAS